MSTAKVTWDICQPVRPKCWNLFTQSSQSETKDYIKDVDPDLTAVTLARNLHDYDMRDIHDVRKQTSLFAENCQIAAQIFELMEYQIARGRVLFLMQSDGARCGPYHHFVPLNERGQVMKRRSAHLRWLLGLKKSSLPTLEELSV